MQRRIISVDFDATGELLIVYFAVIKYLGKNGNTVKQCYRLTEASNSVGREVLYDILIGLGILMKLVRLIKLCLNETCSRAKICPTFFLFRMVRDEMVYRHCFSTML